MYTSKVNGVKSLQQYMFIEMHKFLFMMKYLLYLLPFHDEDRWY